MLPLADAGPSRPEHRVGRKRAIATSQVSDTHFDETINDAEILGFNSGEQMIQLIAGAKFADRDLPSRVRKIMSERHGDMDMAALADAAP